MLKNFITISLVVFIVVVIGILGVGVFANQNKQVNNFVTNNPTPTTTDSSITTSQVALHNTSSDCWVIISGNVYNATSYIPLHPGGPDKIISLCGQDATTAFTTRGGKGPHPAKAQDVLNNYYVGNLAR